MILVDHRTHDFLTIPRAGAEEAWMDVQVGSFEARRAIGRAYVEVKHQRDPLPDLYAADRRLVRLTEYARRRAAEAAGITYIAPGQMPLPDGCFGDKSTA